MSIWRCVWSIWFARLREPTTGQNGRQVRQNPVRVWITRPFFTTDRWWCLGDLMVVEKRRLDFKFDLVQLDRTNDKHDKTQCALWSLVCSLRWTDGDVWGEMVVVKKRRLDFKFDSYDWTEVTTSSLCRSLQWADGDVWGL